jgi:hypothetical protein
MKNLLKNVSAALIISLIILNSGCEKNDPSVPTADRDKFIGTWNGTSTGSGGSRTFNMNIKASNSAPDQVLMEEFDGLAAGQFIKASVSGSTITIISTAISGETYEGSGSLSGNKITFAFTIDDGQTVESRSATITKQ